VGISPPIRNQYLDSGQVPDTSRSELPPSEKPRMVKTRSFELEYSVDSAGPASLGRVELWGTRDGGRTWASYGVDHDGRTPMPVTLHDEGLYGFRIAVQDDAGFESRKPREGDEPDLWLGVDLTEPRVQILSAEQGTGHQAGQLIIRWQADDQRLSARPVGLFYGDSPEGPWLPIASGLENTGRHAWPVDRRASQRIYVRLEVRDEAGNVGVCQTAQAVALDPLRPTVRIHDVRPVVESARTPSGRYRVRR
jgi:hypothetical protein